MRFFQKSGKTGDIDGGVRRCRETEGGLLLDIRRESEYSEGHILGSRNIPLSELDRVEWEIPNKATPLFVYCLSGRRSQKAAKLLKGMGYTAAENIGGIQQYHGELGIE